MKKLNLVGKKFGRLEVIKESKERLYNRITWICKCNCGNIKKVTSGDLKSGKLKSCNCLSSENTIKRNKKRSGGNSDCWKGGLIKCNGYWYVYKPDHPNANAMDSGYVKRSRIIMEKKLGRYLKRNEFIHHKDENKENDDPKNLELTTNSKHKKYHILKDPTPRNKLGQFTTKGGDAL